MRRIHKLVVLAIAGSLLLGACETAATSTLAPVPTSVEPSPPATVPPVPVTSGASAEANSVQPTHVPSEGEGNANVLQVRAVEAADGSWTFHVTVEHPDTGWEDYADGWDVVTPDGTVLKPDPDSRFTRLLLHPHLDEQPFTRSQAGIVIPPGVEQVSVRAHDLVDGYGGREVLVNLSVSSGPDFQVERRQ